MDAQQFLKAFGHVANAPGGVDQLRAMVYQLAITGALVAQVASEGNSRQLLSEIAAARNRLVNTKAYKRLPKLESKALEAPPQIALPGTWCWTRLLDIGEISPRNDAPDSAPASFIPMSGFSKRHGGTLSVESTGWGDIKKGFTHFRNGDVVIAKITPCFENGKAAVIEGLKHGIGSGTTELQVFRPIHDGVLPDYVYIFLRSPYFAIEGEKSMTGTAGQKRLPTEYFATRPLPLPPTDEQARIVANVNELMALCDKLEAQQQARRQLQNSLRQATLQAVANATSPHDLQTTWASLAANFGRLFHAPEDVAAIKGAILDLAMSGQLIGPAHRQASTGTALLEEISAQRMAWAQAASGQEQKEALAMLKKLRIQSVTEPEITLPQHWTWATLLHVAKVIIDCDHKTPIYATNGIHLIRTTDIRNGSMHLHSTKKVSQESYLARSKRLTPECGDIFFTREAPMGEAAIVPDGEQVCLGQRLMLIRLFDKHASNRFLLYAIQSPSFQRRMQAAAVGMTVKHINVGDVENLFVPMPPLLEQDQIVSTIDALFTLCDQYAGQLSRKLDVARRMGSSVINSFTGITTIQTEEPMKAPQTELIAPLRLGQAPDIKAQAPLATILARHQGQMPAKDLWQRFGGEIDAFYAQLKTEVAHGWILEPDVAEVREVPAATAGA